MHRIEKRLFRIADELSSVETDLERITLELAEAREAEEQAQIYAAVKETDFHRREAGRARSDVRRLEAAVSEREERRDALIRRRQTLLVRLARRGS